jgi:hypothetical protein
MTRFAPLGLHRCRLIMAAVIGSWLMANVCPALAQSVEIERCIVHEGMESSRI